MGYETRQAPRHKIDLRVKCRIPAEDKQTFALASGNSCEVTAVDINESGMGLVSEHFLPRGLIVDLEIEGKEFGLEENMLIKAKICHSRHQGIQDYPCGVKFIDLSPKYKKAIAEFIINYDKRRSPRIKLAS